MESIFHNSHDILYRDPFGAASRGTKINLKITACGFEKCYLHIINFDDNKEAFEMDRDVTTYTYLLDTSKYWGVIYYYFELIDGNGYKVYYGNKSNYKGGVGQVYYQNPVSYQVTVYDDFKIPDWYKEGVMYHIFVDRFFNGNLRGEIKNKKKNSFIYSDWNDTPMYVKNNKGEIVKWDFFGGNLQGIIKKLPYLKSLGVTILYLSPIFEASSNHKYDTGDYKTIDPMFGDDEILKGLCEKAAKYNMKVILDVAFSHTGDDSIYFNKYGNYKSVGAYQSKASKYYNWYNFKNYPDDYECWWGTKSLPNVNELNESYLDYIIREKESVVNKWMELGVYGFRLDVADELPDEFIEILKAKLKENNEESVLLGEVWEDASNKVSYDKKRKYVYGKELDCIMNYPLRNAILSFINGHISSFEFDEISMSLYENYPKELYYGSMNFLGTHDTERVLTIFNEDIDKLFLATLIQMTFPGVPSVFYGDEAGLTGLKDPENRKCYPWGNENIDILSFYHKLMKLRKLDIFKKGDIKFYNLHSDVLSYERKFNGKSSLILLNRTKQNIGLKLQNNKDIILKEYFTNNIYEFKNSALDIEIEAMSFLILMQG